MAALPGEKVRWQAWRHGCAVLVVALCFSREVCVVLVVTLCCHVQRRHRPRRGTSVDSPVDIEALPSCCQPKHPLGHSLVFRQQAS